MGAERNRLDKAQKFKLMKMLEEKLPSFAANNTTSSRVAEIATEVLGFPVTQDNITSLAGRSKEAIFEHQWPGGLTAGAGGNHQPRAVALIVDVVNQLKLQVERLCTNSADDGSAFPVLSDETAVLWNELLAQVKATVGETAEPSTTPEPTT